MKSATLHSVLAILNKVILVVLFLLLLFLIVIFWVRNRSVTEYYYSVDVGAPAAYSMLFDYDENYLINKDEQRFLNFTYAGRSPAIKWGQGIQASYPSKYYKLPHGIKVRWFSVAENQFWEGQYPFDLPLLERLNRHVVNDVVTNSKKAFGDRFNIIVYVVPGGLVTVWVSNQGEKYLLAQFQADKVDEPNWEKFAQRAYLPKETSTRESYIEKILENEEMTQTKNELLANKVPASDFWRNLMTTYFWQLTVNDTFKLKDYLATYVNGEQFYTYQKDEQLKKARAVPNKLVIYFEDKKKELHRLDLYFEKDELQQAFVKMAAIEPIYEPINFHLKIREDIKEITAFLVKGDAQIEIHNITANYPNLYNRRH